MQRGFEMIANYAYGFALLASTLWFAAAFRYFSFQNRTAAKVLIPKSARSSPLFETMTVFTPFLGGMNGALALLSMLLFGLWVADVSLFVQPGERGVLLLALTAAHFSQFVFNVPVWRNGERQGEAYWFVVSGPMFFIFVMDAVQTGINFIGALLQLSL